MQATIRVLGIEVVQSIQNLDNEIPLLAGKQTVVRVYVRPNKLAVDMPVTGTLELRRTNGRGVVVASDVKSDLSVQLRTDAIGNDDDAYVEKQRRSLDRSLNFRLSQDQTKQGKVEVQLKQVTPVLTSDFERLEVEVQGNAVAVTFQPGPTLRVRAVGLRVRDPQTGDVHVPKPAHFKALKSYLERAFPVSTVEWSEITVDAADGFEPPYSDGPVSIANPGPEWQRKFDTACAQLMAIRARDVEGGLDQRTHYYGMVYHPDDFFVGAVSNVPGTARPDTVGIGPAELEDGSYGAHELAHALGRLHPGFCERQAAEDPHFPAEYHGKLSSSDAGNHHPHHGLDVGDSIEGCRVLPFDEWYDLMTYCRPLWVSAYSYEGMLERLRAEEGLAPKGEAGNYLQIIGTYNIDNREGAFSYVFPVSRRSLASNQNKGRVVVVGKDAGGKELRRWNVELKRPEATDLAQNSGAFQITVERDKLAKLELRVDDFTVAERSLSKAPSTALKKPRVDGPSYFEKGQVRISPPVTSPDDPYLLQITWPTLYDRDWRHTVQARLLRDAAWQTIAVDITDDTTELLLDRRRFDLGRSLVLVQILRTDGILETPIYKETLTVAPRSAPEERGTKRSRRIAGSGLPPSA